MKANFQYWLLVTTHFSGAIYSFICVVTYNQTPPSRLCPIKFNIELLAQRKICILDCTERVYIFLS